MIIEFTVNYGLEEYLSIVGDYTVALTRKKELEKYPDKKPSESYPFTIHLFRFFASIAFYIKKRRMPESSFVIDEDQILRKTKHGTLIIKWTEIIELHESLDGFILIKHRGGLPLPFRCLTESERNWIKDRYNRLNSEKI